jgi:hypothetical protein
VATEVWTFTRPPRELSSSTHRPPATAWGRRREGGRAATADYTGRTQTIMRANFDRAGPTPAGRHVLTRRRPPKRPGRPAAERPRAVGRREWAEAGSAGASTSAPPPRTAASLRWLRRLATTTFPACPPYGSASAPTTCSTTRTSHTQGDCSRPASPAPCTYRPALTTPPTPSNRKPPSPGPSSRPKSPHWRKHSTAAERTHRMG